MARQLRARGGDSGSLFAAESDYAQSMLCSMVGDGEGCVEALRSSLEWLPTYAPAILSLGSVEYQLDRAAEGCRLFLSLLELADDTRDLTEIIDEAGAFLISIGAYADGLRLYRAAAARFPEVAALHGGISCCAGHEGSYAEAVAAAEAALALEPNQVHVNDLGWSLYCAGRLEEAYATLTRATEMDPGDALATENLRVASELACSERGSAPRQRRTG